MLETHNSKQIMTGTEHAESVLLTQCGKQTTNLYINISKLTKKQRFIIPVTFVIQWSA